MGWDDVATLWDNSNDKDKVSSTSKEHVKDMRNNVDVENGHIDRHAGNVDHGHTDGHTDTRTWSDLVSRCTIRGRKMQQ